MTILNSKQKKIFESERSNVVRILTSLVFMKYRKNADSNLDNETLHLLISH